MDTSEIAQKKRTLRHVLRSRRDGLNTEEKAEKSLSAAQHLFAFLQQHVSPGFLGCYVAFGSEADPSSAIRQLQAPWQIAYPRVQDRMLHFYQASSSSNDFEQHPMGFLQPTARACEVDGSRFAAHVVPGLAFSPQGHRLGYGQGYYDRYLQLFPSALRIGFCYSFQILTDVPLSIYDQPLDALVSETQVLMCSSRHP